MILADLLLMATGSGLTLAGGIVGYLVRPRRTPPDPQQCGCAHHWALHDPEADKCHGQVLCKDMWDPAGTYIGRQWVPCPCRQYTGEKPLDLDQLMRPLPEIRRAEDDTP